MSDNCPDYVVRALAKDERVLLFVPEPPRSQRLWVLLKISPLFALVGICIYSLTSTPRHIGLYESLVALACIVLPIVMFVMWLRLCRTSFAITSDRVLLFVSDRSVRKFELRDCYRPEILSMAESKAFIHQAMSKVFRLAPVVRLVKKAPSPMTLRSFITGFDDRELRIGTPLQHMPTERIFEVTTRGWEAAQ